MLWLACKRVGQNSTKSDQVKQDFKLRTQGLWKSPFVKIKIGNDSISFIQELVTQSFPLSVVQDSLIVHFPKFDYKYKMSLIEGDSLLLEDDKSKSVFYRVH